MMEEERTTYFVKLFVARSGKKNGLKSALEHLGTFRGFGFRLSLGDYTGITADILA